MLILNITIQEPHFTFYSMKRKNKFFAQSTPGPLHSIHGNGVYRQLFMVS